MTPFEYLTVLVSIILGMGITQIVTGVADLVHQWERVKIYWPHLLWIILVFFLHIQEWWATYELRHFDSFRLPTFLFVLLYPINLFILARILFPLVQGETGFDLRNFYFANYRKFFLWAALLPVLSVLNNIFVTGHPFYTQAPHLLIFSVLISLIMLKKPGEFVHKALAVLLLSLMLIDLVVTWNDALSLS